MFRIGIFCCSLPARRFYGALLCATLLTVPAVVGAPSGKIVKESISSQEEKRTFYLYVPVSVSATKRAPLLVLLHGSGGNGAALVEKWRDLADKEGIILAGPNSLNSVRWSAPKDGPAFLYDLIEALKSRHPINPRRVYLFGYSAGSGFALNMSLLESEYFTAAAVYASATIKKEYLDAAQRNIPLAISAGTDDQVFPIREVRETREALVARGFAVEYSEITGHDHNYSALAAKLNAQAWAFLSRHELAEEPRYIEYQFNSKK